MFYLMFCFQCFKIFFDLFHIFFQEHQAEADGQQQAGEPDGLCAAKVQRQAAQARAQRKQEDDAPVIKGFFQVAAFWVRYNDTSNPAGKLFTELHKNRPAHWVQTDIIRAPVPVCGGVVRDVAAFCFPGQYGWIRVCVEYA